MVFNPMALLQERQCGPIYESLDAGRAATALQQADQVLASQANNHLAASLRALALSRTGKTDEANTALDRLIKTGDLLSSSSAISALCYALNETGRKADEADVLEAASKAHPTSLDYGRKACLAFAQSKQWQRLQQTALRISKQAASSSNEKDANASDLYFWWSMQAYSIVAENSSLTGYQLALPLARRMIGKHLESKPFGESSDESMYLYARILQKQDSTAQKEALQLLSATERGRALCEKSAALHDIRRQLLEEQGEWQTVYDEGMTSLQKDGRNWAIVEQTVKASERLAERGDDSIVSRLESQLLKLAQEHPLNRTLRLAPLYQIKQCQERRVQNEGGDKLLSLVKGYFDAFATKGCTFEDLDPYLRLLDKAQRTDLLGYLDEHVSPTNTSFENFDEMYRHGNATKLQRRVENCEKLEASSEGRRALQYLQLYLFALPLGKDLPKTEMQPADDFALMAAHAFLLQGKLAIEEKQPQWRTCFTQAVAILEAALQHSPKGYRLRILLMLILVQFGAVDAAREHYDEIGIKAIQNETLGWLMSTRYSILRRMLKPNSKESQKYEESIKSISSVWTDARKQVPPMIAKTLEHGTFSRTEEMIDFERRLENSMSRHLHVAEMSVSHALDAESRGDRRYIDSERQRVTMACRQEQASDQRDWDVALDLLPFDIEGGLFGILSPSFAARPDEKYLKALLDVGAVAADEESHEPLLVGSKEASSLSTAESHLHALALAFLQTDVNTQAADVSKCLGQLAALLSETDDQWILPVSVLHDCSIALEAALLVQKRTKEGQGGSLPASMLDAAGNLLKDLRERLAQFNQHEPDSNSSAIQATESTKLFGQLASSLAVSLSQRTLLDNAEKKLNDGTKHAIEALEARAAAALSTLTF